ncbi:MAG TPA: OsmC family protein [Polyangia bacterium]|jgi:uncharacterized OsmC-like protein|nr:OsmC family protein [Polyangia bacterium]
MAEPNNGVNLDALKQTDKMLREDPGMAKMTLAAKASWDGGTRTTVTISDMRAGNGASVVPPTRRFTVTVDDPEALGGRDGAPAGPEMVLAALAGCVTAGIATNAALFNVPIDQISIDFEADMDGRGMFGHDKTVRNGITDIRYTVTIQSSAPEEAVRRCKETIDRKSPVRDTLANPVNVTSNFVYKPR